MQNQSLFATNVVEASEALNTPLPDNDTDAENTSGLSVPLLGAHFGQPANPSTTRTYLMASHDTSVPLFEHLSRPNVTIPVVKGMGGGLFTKNVTPREEPPAAPAMYGEDNSLTLVLISLSKWLYQRFDETEKAYEEIDYESFNEAESIKVDNIRRFMKGKDQKILYLSGDVYYFETDEDLHFFKLSWMKNDKAKELHIFNI